MGTFSHIVEAYVTCCSSASLEVWSANTGKGSDISVINPYLYGKQTSLLIFMWILYLSLNYSWTKHCRNGFKDLQTQKYMNHIQYNLNKTAAVANVTMTWRGIVKVCVCCGDASVSGECLRAKEEVWRFLRWGQIAKCMKIGSKTNFLHL